MVRYLSLSMSRYPDCFLLFRAQSSIYSEKDYINKGNESLGILSADDLEAEEIIETYEYYEDP